MSSSEKNGNISSIKRLTRKFLEVSRKVVVKQNNAKEMYKKSLLYVQSCIFANYTCGYFCCSFCLRRLALHDFIYCLKNNKY